MDEEDEVVAAGGAGGPIHPDDWKYSRVGTESCRAFGAPVSDK